MTKTKKAQTRQGQGPKLNSLSSYQNNYALSTAAKILMLIEQSPEHADHLRQACWNRLEAVLRRHYESGAGR